MVAVPSRIPSSTSNDVTASGNRWVGAFLDVGENDGQDFMSLEVTNSDGMERPTRC
jgi:hypothetical protein